MHLKRIALTILAAATTMLNGLSASIPTPPLAQGLLAERSIWRTVSLYEDMTFRWETSRSDNDGPVLIIQSGRDPQAIGAWSRPLEGFKAGKEYLIEVQYRSRGLKDPAQHVQALLLKSGREFHELEPVNAPARNGWHKLQYHLRAREDYQDVELRLYLHNARNLAVEWKEVRLTELVKPLTRRKVKVGAISGPDRVAVSQAEAIGFYLQRLEEAGAMGLDLVCLPENINIDLVPGERPDLAEAIPGNTTRLLGEVAKKYGMYVVAGLSEMSTGKLYNTAVLIDRSGTLIGKYRKTHLTLTENLIWGIIPGDSYPVFETDFGKIGLMVCYDNHFTEVSRILAVKGAELLIMPNASDGRETGNLWEPYMMTRALDNHVYLLSGVNFGRSIIVSPRGEVLDINQRYTEEPGGIVQAEIELGTSVANWSGESIGKRYLSLRRPQTYDELGYAAWSPNGLETPEETARLRAGKINHMIGNAESLTADTPVSGIKASVVVASHAELEEALHTVDPGTEIIIKSGTLLHNIDLERSFPQEHPVLLRAEQTGAVEVAGAWTVTGSGYVLSGLKWNSVGSNLEVRSSHVRVTRCAFLHTGNKEAGPESVILVRSETGETIRDIRIDRCEIAYFRQYAIAVWPNGEIHEVTIDHNHIHHMYGSGKPRANGLAIYVGTDNAHREKRIGALVAYNLIQDLLDENNLHKNSGNTIHLKSSGNYILFNYVTGQPEMISKIDVRHGRDNVLAGNRIVTFGTVRTKDYNSILLGNVAETIRVDSGNVEYDYSHMRHQPDIGYSTKPAARNTLLVGNSGQVQLGFEFDENQLSNDRERTSVANTVIYDHAGDVNVIRRNSFDWAGDWRDLRDWPGPDYLAVPQAVELSPAMVGPAAPTE